MATTVWTVTTTSTNSGDNGATYRNRCAVNTAGTGLLAASQGQVRVRFAADTGGLHLDHASIGVAKNAKAGVVADFDTVATPVELLFSGAHGFNIGAGLTITSDWVNLSFLITNELIVVLDFTSGGTADTTKRGGITSGDGEWYFLAATASYNVATTPAGGTINNLDSDGINLIETQSGSASFQRRPSGLFVPGRHVGPTHGMRSRRAFPLPVVSVPSTQPLTATSSAMGSGQAGPSVKASLAATSIAEAKATDALTGKAALVARTSAQAQGRNQAAGALSLLARSIATAQGRAAASGKTALAATSAGMAKAASAVTNSILLVARSIAQAQARAQATGALPLLARSVGEAQARAAAQGRVALAASTSAAAKATATVTNSVFLLARSIGVATGRASGAFALALSARSQAQGQGLTALSGALALAARSIALAKGAATAVNTVFLAARSAAMASGRAVGSFALALAAASRAAGEARAAFSGNAALATVGKAIATARNTIGSGATIALFAVSSALAQGRAAVTGVAALRSAGAAMAQGRAALTGVTPLRAASTAMATAVNTGAWIAGLVARAPAAAYARAAQTSALALAAAAQALAQASAALSQSGTTAILNVTEAGDTLTASANSPQPAPAPAPPPQVAISGPPPGGFIAQFLRDEQEPRRPPDRLDQHLRRATLLRGDEEDDRVDGSVACDPLRRPRSARGKLAIREAGDRAVGQFASISEARAVIVEKDDRLRRGKAECNVGAELLVFERGDGIAGSIEITGESDEEIVLLLLETVL